MEDQEEQGDSQKIDMSLDDIIKLQKDEAGTQASVTQTAQERKTRNTNFRANRFFRGAPLNQQGLNRQKFGFKKQRYSGVNLTNNRTGPMNRGRRASLNGVSPLKRYNPTNQITQNASVSYSYSLRPQSGTQRRTPQQRRFRPAATPVQVLTRSTQNAQNGRPQFNNTQRKQSIYSANKNRWSTPLNRRTPETMQQTLRRWKSKDGFGSTLTVSVNNPIANQNKMSGKPGVQRLGLGFRKPESEHRDPSPKGVPLKFNFRAMANHTNVTLNERFTTLKSKEQFTPTRQGGRTVILA